MSRAKPISGVALSMVIPPAASSRITSRTAAGHHPGRPRAAAGRAARRV